MKNTSPCALRAEIAPSRMPAFPRNFMGLLWIYRSKLLVRPLLLEFCLGSRMNKEMKGATKQGGNTMKRPHLSLRSSVILAGALLAGCATGTTEPFATSCGTDYTCLRDTAFQYRQQAGELSALAQRYEIEAEAKSRELGQDAEQVKRHRDLASQYWSEAEQADELARQYRNQLPHNVMN